MNSRLTPITAPLTVLVVDDDAQVRRVIRQTLATVSLDGLGQPGAVLRVVEAATAADAAALAVSESPFLVILDLMLPDGDGSALLSNLRLTTQASLVVISSIDDAATKARIIDAGADDYVVKPFSTSELSARLRALIRRSWRAQPASTPRRIRFGRVHVDLTRRQVDVDGNPVHLTPTEYGLLLTFLDHAGVVLTHQQLFDRVWGRKAGDAQQYLRVYVACLRKKLEDSADGPQYFHTISGIGYKFDPRGAQHT